VNYDESEGAMRNYPPRSRRSSVKETETESILAHADWYARGHLAQRLSTHCRRRKTLAGS
jgi:hypothetical protein